MSWMLKKIMSVVILAADDNFRNNLEYVDESQLVTKLGPESTPTKFGGKVVPKLLAPENFDGCVDLIECAKAYSISNQDLKKAEVFYEKLANI